MASNIAFVRPPEPLEINSGNPAHSWKKWKQKFEIYLKATGSSTKTNEVKVGLLLNHIGDQCLEIYGNFQFLPERANPDGGDNLRAESPDNYKTVIEKFDQFFTKRDPQLMLREKFWYQLNREPTQSFDSWVVTVKERAAECKFPPDFLEQAVRDKLTFSCTDDRPKLKLYDEGASLTLDKTMTILSMKEATNRELQETKTASIENVRQRPLHSSSTPRAQPPSTKTQWRRPEKCGYCGRNHPRGKPNCPAANTRCDNCSKIGHFAAVCRSKPGTRVSQVQDEAGEPALQNSPMFVGMVTTQGQSINTSAQNREYPQTAQITVDQTSQTMDPGWHIKLKIDNQELTWCIDTGAQVSVMPEYIYRKTYGTLAPPDRRLVGAGDNPLTTIGQTTMHLTLGEIEIKEQVYIVRGAKKLLLGIPAIRSLGLIHDIPNTYSVRVVDCNEKPLALDTTAKVHQQYPNLFTGLGKLKGEYTIRLKDGAKPFCLTTPRRIPLPLQKKAEEEIRRMVNLGVIEPVDEPTDWCAPIVVVPKPNGDVRICVDLTKLNKEVRREVYQMPKVEETLGSIAKGTVYSKLDANSGFHQVPLSDESAKLTTFITPSGRYMFRRLPYGISSAPEHFQKRMDRELAGLEGVLCHMDDILVVGRNQTEHDQRLARVLDKLTESGLTLNPEKCKFSQTRIEYLGQIIDNEGVRKNPAKVKAILEMDVPEDISGLRRFLGMVNQLMKFCPNLAEKTQPLRDLLKKNNAWVWGKAQQDAFSDLKIELASDRVLALYSPDRETVVSADASSFGLGAVLMQRQPSGVMRPVAYASRSMTNTERRYAQIEKEALATTWALEHWSDLLIGMKFTVETDHKPLVPLFTTKLIDELPVRIQRFRMRLMRYDFDTKHVPGKELYTADTLSRSPVDREASEKATPHDELRKEADCYVNTVLVNLPASDKRLDEIRTELKNDDTLRLVVHYVQHGWPETKHKLYGPVNKYWSERGNLSVHEGLLMRGRRLIIPPKLRSDVLRYLHDGHQGVTKTRENAAQSVWWPGISTEIERLVRDCALCAKYRRERIEPMKGTEFPDRPWSRVAADFFQHEAKCYLVVVDYYSRDIEISTVTKNVTTADTITKMKNVFSRHGIPDVLMTDNGPQFGSAEFRRFAAAWGFEHITSSPLYPQSNGESERAVETLKMFLRKCDDEYLALLTYRNTPLHNGYSPAQLSMGRKLKTRVPCHPDELKPCLPDYGLLRKKEAEYRRNMQTDYNRRHRVVEGEEISEGDRVWIPDLKTGGTVTRHHESPRSLIIQTPNSQVRRNRRMVRRALAPSLPQQSTNVGHRKLAIPEAMYGGTYTSLTSSVPNQLRQLPNVPLQPESPTTTRPLNVPLQPDSPTITGLEGRQLPLDPVPDDQPLSVDEQPGAAEQQPLRRSQRIVRRPRRYIEEN